MSRCAVAGCKRLARYAANLCPGHWNGLDKDMQTNIAALAEAAKGNDVAARQQYKLAQGRLVIALSGPSLKMKV